MLNTDVIEQNGGAIFPII